MSHHPLAEAFLSLPTAPGRVLAAFGCGHDGVAAEAARLLTRLWAPAAARVGAGARVSRWFGMFGVQLVRGRPAWFGFWVRVDGDGRGCGCCADCITVLLY